LAFSEFGLEFPDVADTLVATSSVIGAYFWFKGADERATIEKWREFEEREKSEREVRRQLAYLAPKPLWKLSEIQEFNGIKDMRGPLLIAVDGSIYNAYKGRHFYGPGCEYHIFAGRDATRLLAKGLLEEEPLETSTLPLTLKDRATLAAWVLTFKSKYEVVGRLEGSGPSFSDSVDASIPDFLR